MAPSDDSPEALVLDFIKQQNRPINVQMLADAMQKHGLKKTAIQRALDSLAVDIASLKPADGVAPSAVPGLRAEIIFKDYGKQRIYMARQDNLQVLSKEQMEAMHARTSNLQEEARQLRDQCVTLGKECGVLESSLTLPQLREQIQLLSAQNAELEGKLQTLQGATNGVSTEERQKVDEDYSKYVGIWRKRKRMFMELWGTVTENFPRKLKDFKEELAIEMDEDVGCNLADFVPRDAPLTPLASLGLKRRPVTPVKQKVQVKAMKMLPAQQPKQENQKSAPTKGGSAKPSRSKKSKKSDE